MNGVLPIRLEQAGLSSAGRPLLDRIDLTLDGQNRTVILGPNGAGKSLLLRLAHGLIAPDHGRVTWGGRCPDDTLRRRQAMVFQQPVMLRRTALDNVAYPLILHGATRRARRIRAEQALDRFGLSHLAGRMARTLSGGEQQRLALARAWVIEPEILFLDEATTALDPAACFQVEQAVLAFHRQGVKIVMVTHDLAQARRLGQDIVFLFRGRVHEQGSASHFFTQPQTAEARAFLAGQLVW